MTSANSRARHHVFGIVAVSLFAALFTRLWYLQVLTTDDFELAAQSNRTQEVILDAPRGRILDRNAQVLVENRRSIQVTVSYQDFIDLDPPEQSEVLRRLGRRAQRGPAAALRRRAGAQRPRQRGADAAQAARAGPPLTRAPSRTRPGRTRRPRRTTRGRTRPGSRPPGWPPAPRTPTARPRCDEAAPEPVTEETLRDRLEDPRFSKFKPVPVATDISEQLEMYLRENPEEFPTVTVERVTVRDYNYGALLAHVLGYVGSITDDELATAQNDEKPYENDDEIGKSGIEAGMERELRGTPGRVVYEVDARNRPIEELVELRRSPSRAATSTSPSTSTSSTWSRRAWRPRSSAGKGVSDNGCFVTACDPPGGAAVAVDPRNGQVLAMASYPTYDPNLFVGRHLHRGLPGHRLRRAGRQAPQPPASTGPSPGPTPPARPSSSSAPTPAWPPGRSTRTPSTTTPASTSSAPATPS